MKFKKKKSSSGFGLTELLVSAGLLGFIGLAVATLGVNLFKMQGKNVVMSEMNEFASSLGYYLKQSCHDEFNGEVFPYSALSNPPSTPLVVGGYKGFGDFQTGSIETGTIFEDKWKVTNLVWKHKTSIPGQEYRREDEDYTLVVATISIQSELIQIESENIRMPIYSVEIPFLIDPDTKKIVDCMSARGLAGEDICAIIGAEYDPDTKTCMPDQNCFLLTQFVNCTSDKGSNPNSQTPDSPCDELIKPEVEHYTFNYYNENDTGSCPTDADMILSGEVSRREQHSCGKKCTNTYYATGKIYLCMACKDDTS